MSWFSQVKEDFPEASGIQRENYFPRPSQKQQQQRPWTLPQPAQIEKIRRIMQTETQDLRRKERLQQLLKGVDDYMKLIQTSPKWQQVHALQNWMRTLEWETYLKPDEYVFAQPKDIAEHRINEGFKDDARLMQEKERRRRCNIKVLEVSQWTSTAENMTWNSLEGTDPDMLFGGDADAARKLNLNNENVKWVCPEEKPPKGYVWLKDGTDGTLKVWKANYDSSD